MALLGGVVVDEQDRILKRFDDLETRISGVDGRLIRVEEKLISIDARLVDQATHVLSIVMRLDLLSTTNLRVDQAHTRLDKTEEWIKAFWAKVIGVGVGISVLVRALGNWIGRH